MHYTWLIFINFLYPFEPLLFTIHRCLFVFANTNVYFIEQVEAAVNDVYVS